MFKIQNKPKSTLNVNSVTRVKSTERYTFPTTFLNIIITMITMYCMIKIVFDSFSLFENNIVDLKIYNIYFTTYEREKFYTTAMLGCAAICIVNSLKKHSVKATFGLFSAYALYFLYNYKLVANGFVHALNKAVFTIEANKGLTSEVYYLTYFDSTAPKTEMKYFCFAVIFGTCFLLAFSAIKHCNPIIFTALVALFAAVPLAFNVFNGEIYFIIAAACCIVLFAQSIQGYSSSAPKEAVFGIRSRLKLRGKYVSFAAFQQTIAFLLCITLTLGTVSLVYDYSEYERSESVDEFGKDLLDTVQTIGSGNFTVAFGNTNSGLNNGDLSRTGNIEYTGETMFKLKIENQRLTESLYLRAYTAANYDGKRWTQLTKKSYNTYKDMWDTFESDTFYPQFMYGILNDVFKTTSHQNKITIVNENANGKIFLTDTGLIPSSTQLLSSAKTQYDNAFETNAMLGTDSYEQTIVSSPSAYDDMYLLDESPRESITDVLRNGHFSYMYGLSSYYPENDEEYQKNVEDFYEKERQYRSFVLDNYLDYPEVTDNYIPEGFDENVQEIYEQYKTTNAYSFDTSDGTYYVFDDVSGNMTGGQTITNSYVVTEYYNEIFYYINEYLHENAEYTLTPGSTPYGTDFVEYFIKENHKGYCVHFATAATLLLRRAGIPARYVEGYFVGGNDLSNTDIDGYSNIPDSNAHAWTEVYFPLMGWQVVDFTPSYGDEGEVPEENNSWKEQETDTESDSDSETDTVTDEESDESDTQSDTDSESDSDSTDLSANLSTDTDSTKNGNQSGFVKGIIKVLKIALSIILILAAVVLLWLAARYICNKIRHERFFSKDRRKSAKAMYLHSLRLLALVGISPKANEGEEEFAKRVSKELLQLESKEFEQFTGTALTARFGRIRPTKEEIAEMQAFTKKLSVVVYESSGKCKKLIIKYILFLH